MGTSMIVTCSACLWCTYELGYGVHVGHLPHCCPSLAISDTTIRVAHFKNPPSKVFKTQCVGLCASGSVQCYVHCSTV